MRTMWRVMFSVLGLTVVAPAAYAQSHGQQGGMNQYPRNDAEARLIRGNLPEPVKISRGSLRGDVVARGRRVQKPAGTPGSDCEFDFGFKVELYSGSREVVLQPQADCTVTLESVTDVDGAAIESPYVG